MGFLELGDPPLHWKDVEKCKGLLKQHGLEQLMHLWRINSRREDAELKWGEEIEYCLVKFDHEKKDVTLYTDAAALIDISNDYERQGQWPDAETVTETAAALCGSKLTFLRSAEWHPEFGKHMVECTPNPPYEMNVDSLLEMEPSLASRRYKLQSLLPEDVFATSLAVYPRLGLEIFHDRQSHNAMAPEAEAEVEAKAKADMVKAKADGSVSRKPRPQKLSYFESDEFLNDCTYQGFRELINDHPRFATLVNNLVRRRKGFPVSLIPIYRDELTHTLFKNSCCPTPPHTFTHDNAAHPLVRHGKAQPRKRSRAAVSRLPSNDPFICKDHIYLNHFGFGMSQSCVQMTYGTANVSQARYLYDQLAVLAPIFLCLSAAAPFARGALTDTDTRWQILEGGCDSRTDAEAEVLRQSRYGAVQMYIADPSCNSLGAQCRGSDYLINNLEALNDFEVPVDLTAYTFLREAHLRNGGTRTHTHTPTHTDTQPHSITQIDDRNVKEGEPSLSMSPSHNPRPSPPPLRAQQFPEMDALMAKHFASLYVQDPLVVFPDKLNASDDDQAWRSDHFENIQSTNWNSVRFKCPPPSPDGYTRPVIGWRVELRTPDLQLSDFANAALCCFSSLLSMAILRHGWNFYVPVSQARENMARAHERNALLSQRFFFRTIVRPEEDGVYHPSSSREMTMAEIFLGPSHKPSRTPSHTPSNTPSHTREHVWPNVPSIVVSDGVRVDVEGVEASGRAASSVGPSTGPWTPGATFPGIIPLLDEFVSSEWRAQRCSSEAVERYRLYANFVRAKVLGRIESDASLLRRLVRKNPKYDRTSRISPEINYDICRFAALAGFGLRPEPNAWGHPCCLPSSARLPGLPSGPARTDGKDETRPDLADRVATLTHLTHSSIGRNLAKLLLAPSLRPDPDSACHLIPHTHTPSSPSSSPSPSPSHSPAPHSRALIANASQTSYSGQSPSVSHLSPANPAANTCRASGLDRGPSHTFEGPLEGTLGSTLEGAVESDLNSRTMNLYMPERSISERSISERSMAEKEACATISAATYSDVAGATNKRAQTQTSPSTHSRAMMRSLSETTKNDGGRASFGLESEAASTLEAAVKRACLNSEASPASTASGSPIDGGLCDHAPTCSKRWHARHSRCMNNEIYR